MKKLLFALSLFVADGLCADSDPSTSATVAAEKSPADLDYERMMAGYRAPLPDGLTRRDRGYWEAMDQKMTKLMQDARAFAAKYPNDLRRYEGLIQSSYTRPYFIKGFKPEFEAQPTEANLIVDQAALNAFRTSQVKYLAEVVTAPDATMRQRGGGFAALIVDSRADAQAHGVSFDLAPIGVVVEKVIAAMPDERALVVVDQYVSLLKQQPPEQVQAFTAKVQSMPSLAAALAAAESKREQAAAEKARRLLDLGAVQFTAADGREVSIAALKGKVVLIDFWATWCGPCIAELPNVVANYNKYHDKGFEVVGITLENPGAIAKDAAAEVIAAKMDAAKKKMLDFTAKNAMPWPQYFDGKFWQNDYAKKFGIEAIPAMFLLDQQGNIVSTEARGPRLEAELKRLLKL